MLICITLLYWSAIFLSNVISQPKNQAFASIVDNDNGKIVDSIKKACPNYEGNGDIKGLITDIMKTCLYQGKTSDNSTNPDSETTTFPHNIMELHASAHVFDEHHIIDATITISDTTSNYLNSYHLTANGNLPAEVSDKFVIPVGDQFSMNVSAKYIGPNPPSPHEQTLDISIISESCNPVSDTMCTGTMGISEEQISIIVTPSS